MSGIRSRRARRPSSSPAPRPNRRRRTRGSRHYARIAIAGARHDATPALSRRCRSLSCFPDRGGRVASMRLRDHYIRKILRQLVGPPCELATGRQASSQIVDDFADAARIALPQSEFIASPTSGSASREPLTSTRQA